MKRIKLTQGKSAIVDDVDYKYLSRWKWCANRIRDEFYAIRLRHLSDGPGPRKIYLHNVIGKRKGIRSGVDHRNRNGLDNRRLNLRSATRSQQMQNRNKQKSNTSGYHGITRKGKKWEVQIWLNGHKSYLGIYKNKTTAAAVYQLASKLLHGMFAKSNFTKKQLAAIRRMNASRG